jgi:hypothetical protein
LGSALRLLRNEFELDLKVGFESEFVLFNDQPMGTSRDQPFLPIDTSLYCASSALDAAADGESAGLFGLG